MIKNIILLIFIFLFNIYADDLELSNSQNKILFSTQQLIKIKKYDKAINGLENFLKKNEKHYYLFLTLGNLYFTKKNFDKAEIAFKQGLEIKKNNLYLNKNIAKLYYRLKQYNESVKYFLKVMKLQSYPEKEVLLYISLCHMNNKNYLSALESFKIGNYYYPENLEFKKGIIQCLFNLDRIDNALPVCKEILKQYPDNSDIRILLAQLYIKKENYKSAIDELEMLVSLKKGNEKVYFLLAQLYDRSKMYEESIKYYLLLYKNNKSDYLKNYEISKVYYFSDKLKKSFEYINKALKFKQKEEALLLKSKILFNQEKLNLSLRTLNKIKSNNGEVYFLKGIIYLKLTDYKSSEKEFHKSKLFDEFKDKSYAYLGDIKYYENKIKESLEFYKLALKYNPDNEEYKKNLLKISENLLNETNEDIEKK